MDNTSIGNMSFEQMDMFREIGNIGAGNAVTALAELLGRRIDMSVPEAQLVEFNEISNILNGPETLVTAMLVDISGELNGYILLIMNISNAYEMVSLVLDPERALPAEVSIADFDEMSMSVLTEVANILVGAYLSSISTLTGLKIIPSVPYVAMDMVGAIISIAAVQYGQIGDSVLFLNTKFSDEDKEMSGHFFLIPDYKSYKILMNSLGMEP